MKREIVITENNIRRGQKCGSGSCPIALAAKDAGFKYVSVGPNRIYYCLPGDVTMYEATLPLKARDFVTQFDGGKPVKPFSFKIRKSKLS